MTNDESSVSDLRQNRRLEIVNDPKPYSRAGTGRTPRPGHTRRAVRWGLSPHPSPPPWGEGEPSLRGEQSGLLGFPLRDARCSLSLRESVRVRGNGVACHIACRTIPGTVLLGEFFCLLTS